jgi:hypothetical protein
MLRGGAASNAAGSDDPTLEALVELLDALIKELDQEEAASESPPLRRPNT